MSSSQEELPKTGSPNPLQGVAEHIRALLARLHAESSAQEGSMTEGDFKDRPFAEVMKDKFIALDEDKSQYVYQLLRVLGATTVVEAGTSYGVSTIYLALAVAANAAASGKAGRVIATEHEPGKCVQARKYWAECGEEVSQQFWAPMALPTLKLVQPKMRHGAVVITDNSIGAAKAYKELLEYLRGPDSGFINLTLPYKSGLEVSVYLPQG
ncbi:uncharacterized protein E0L32_004199 [Thyridium curvatum]|uniref:O-methyltransferase n=1 Tax=Thyridium curvatum TaxID=1093900 RepID=A0A507BC20_9PEZI|nr:uncharacterized protein E0L32_004199 [Thyridium curvatum]TPX16204.1 hypothetical protein E0L32_004199 [Thyridium curvatum]